MASCYSVSFAIIVEAVIAIKAIIVANKPAIGISRTNIYNLKLSVAPIKPNKTPNHCLSSYFSHLKSVHSKYLLELVEE